jgi:hypothetical protein
MNIEVNIDDTGLVGLLLRGVFYFLPTIIGRSKRDAGSIFGLNLLLGWSWIGWLVALVWALKADPPPAISPVITPPGSFCTACGAQMPGWARHCPTCGRPVIRTDWRRAL